MKGSEYGHAREGTPLANARRDGSGRHKSRARGRRALKAISEYHKSQRELADAVDRMRNQIEDDGSHDDAEVIVRAGDVRKVIESWRQMRRLLGYGDI